MQKVRKYIPYMNPLWDMVIRWLFATGAEHPEMGQQESRILFCVWVADERNTDDMSHRIHVWYFYHTNQPNVGK